MKNKLLLLPLLSLTFACGDGLVDHSIIQPAIVSIAPGASAIYDAKNVSSLTNNASGVCDDTNWEDSSGNNNDLTIDCAVAGGKAGSDTTNDPDRIVFDGATTFAAGAFSPQPSTVPNATWIAWVRPAASAFSHILSLDDHGGAFNRSLLTDTDYLVFDGIGPGWDTNSSVTNASWQFVAVTFSATDITLTKNGTKVSYGVAPTYTDTANPFTIGKSAGGAFDFFDGDIAWVAVYPRVLTDAEIKDTCLVIASRFNGATCN